MKILKRVLIAFLLIFTEILLAACRVATPAQTATTMTIPTSAPTSVQDLSTSISTPTSQYLDTPSWIRQALDRGEITEEERLLYLAYALYEYESLPAQFRSNYGWFGESYFIELQEALTPPEVVCSMSPHVRSEFLRLFDSDTACH